LNRRSLAVLAAGPEAFIKLQVMAHHGDPSKHFGTVPDDVDILDRPGFFAVFD